jgi:hypothetical protein
MRHRTDPPHRRPGEELDGAAGCVVFAIFLVVELAVAGVAGLIAYGLARTEPVDVGHGVGIALALVVGLSALLWIDRRCRLLTGHSAGELVLEALCLW